MIVCITSKFPKPIQKICCAGRISRRFQLPYLLYNLQMVTMSFRKYDADLICQVIMSMMIDCVIYSA